MAFGLEQGRIADDLRAALRKVPDLIALSRLSLGRGGPRDLAGIRNALEQAEVIAQDLPEALPNLLATSAQDLGGHEELLDLLDQALIANLRFWHAIAVLSPRV